MVAIEIADVGHQEAQRVADAAVAVDHAGEDFFVDVEVARVVGAGDPQADDFGAQLVVHASAGPDRVAQALAHLAALAVDRETVGQQAFVGRAAIEGAAQQQRAVEPAAVLVVAFQVQVGLGAFGVEGAVGVGLGMAAAQHVLERGAGVEPDLQNVGALGVVRRVVGAQDFFGGHAAPGFDAAFFHDVGRLVEDLHGARVQLAGILVQEEGHGHAPAALAARCTSRAGWRSCRAGGPCRFRGRSWCGRWRPAPTGAAFWALCPW